MNEVLQGMFGPGFNIFDPTPLTPAENDPVVIEHGYARRPRPGEKPDGYIGTAATEHIVMTEGHQPKPGGVPNDQLKRPHGGTAVESPQYRGKEFSAPDGWPVSGGGLIALPQQSAEPMVMIPLEQYRQMLPVATQARYFHCVECDGNKLMLGFYTYEELMHHLDPEQWPSPFDWNQFEPDNADASTICKGDIERVARTTPVG
jgi:hypothetical protein